MQKRAVRLIAGVGRMSHTSPLFRELKILKICDLLHYQYLITLHNYLFGNLPLSIANKFKLSNQLRTTRTIQHFSELTTAHTDVVLPNYRCYNYLLFNVFCQAPRVWNRIIASRIPQLSDVPPGKCFFKKCLRKIFIEAY